MAGIWDWFAIGCCFGHVLNWPQDLRLRLSMSWIRVLVSQLLKGVVTASRPSSVSWSNSTPLITRWPKLEMTLESTWAMSTCAGVELPWNTRYILFHLAIPLLCSSPARPVFPPFVHAASVLSKSTDFNPNQRVGWTLNEISSIKI